MSRWLQALQYEQDVLAAYEYLEDHVTWGVYWSIHATLSSPRSL